MSGDDWLMRAVRHLNRAPDGMDGLILGLAVAAVPFILWLWWTGN